MGSSGTMTGLRLVLDLFDNQHQGAVGTFQEARNDPRVL